MCISLPYNLRNVLDTGDWVLQKNVTNHHLEVVVSDLDERGKALKHLVVWLISVIYFFVLSISLTYLFVPGIISLVFGVYGIGILLIVITALIWYAATAYFLSIAPPRVFTASSGGTFTENLRGLPKLIGVLAIFGVIFVVLSGIITSIVSGAVFPGDSSSAASLINICVIIFAVISLPFYMRAFAGYAGGDRGFGPLLFGSVRMGGLLYLKYLGIGTAVFVLAFFVRYI